LCPGKSCGGNTKDLLVKTCSGRQKVELPAGLGGGTHLTYGRNKKKRPGAGIREKERETCNKKKIFRREKEYIISRHERRGSLGSGIVLGGEFSSKLRKGSDFRGETLAITL